jgi:prevent-host-death family protein
MHVNLDKIIPVAELQTKASQVVTEVTRSGEPVVITRRGRSAAILVDVGQYKELLQTIERLEAQELERLIAQGERERAAGQGIPQEEVKRRLGFSTAQSRGKERRRAR